MPRTRHPGSDTTRTTGDRGHLFGSAFFLFHAATLCFEIAWLGKQARSSFFTVFLQHESLMEHKIVAMQERDRPAVSANQ
jgi:hypothetical protein